MINWRHGPDGVLLAPSRGQAPACPLGYERTPGDPYRFEPEIICQYREQKEIRCGCCKTTVTYYCHRDDKIKFQSACRRCHDRG